MLVIDSVKVGNRGSLMTFNLVFQKVLVSVPAKCSTRPLFIIALLGGIMLPSLVYALPQFPIRFGMDIYGDHMHGHDEDSMTMDCSACHVNPTGGGMRNEHGLQFSMEKLPTWRTSEENEETLMNAKINNLFSIGADLRFAYLLAESESASPYKNSFFPMQADIYFAFMPHHNFTLYYQNGIQGIRETFGLIHDLPYNAHIRFGKFLPPYGLKLDDHTSFIREKLGFGNNTAEDSDAGVEIGFAKGLWFGNAAIFNGSGSNLFTGTGSNADDNRSKGFSATGGLKTPRFWLAGSYFHNTTGEDTSEEKKEYIGAYSALHFWEISLLGEWDHISTETSSSKTKGQVAYVEANTSIYKGVVAKVKYDLYDPDTDASGNLLQRITFGFDLYPYPFTEILIQYRKNKEESNEIRNDQFLTMIHLYF